MRHYTTVESVFEAGHQVPDLEFCEQPHGHRWTISVTVEGTLDPKKLYVVDHGQFLDSLEQVANELFNRDLNDMLPGVKTTPEGIAMYIRERLSLQWPRIVAVRVGMGDHITARVEWDLR